jgi:ABC-type transport system involved in multi-copper enzyme maturation permease subunit
MVCALQPRDFHCHRRPAHAIMTIVGVDARRPRHGRVRDRDPTTGELGMPAPAGWRIGLGPVFAYERLTSSRKWQGYAQRAVFLLFLLVALVVIWLGPSPAAGPNPIRALAALGQSFFIGVVGTQLTLVLLIAPAATAGAICLDRARGTLTHMLMTDLSNAEIVLGKLAARLVPVLALVGCTVPLLEILTLLGGVDPNALLGAFLVTLGIGLLGCSLALVFSVWSGKTNDALLATYAVLGVWLLCPYMVPALSRMLGAGLPIPPTYTDPYLLSFAPYWSPGSVSWGDYFWFLGVTSAVSVALAGVAVLRIRAVCTREVVRRKKTPMIWFRAVTEAYRRRRPSPSLDWNPVFWRELHRARPSRLARLVGALYVMIAGVFTYAVMVAGSTGSAAWVNGLQVAAGLLFLSVGSATSLADERVRGSLDLLMTTRLSTAEIVLGKWLGSYRFVPFLAVLPVLVVFSFVWNDSGRWLAVGLLAGYVLCAGAAITSLGLAMATWCSRPGRALAATVGIFISITAGWVFLEIALSGAGPRTAGMMMASPFYCAGYMTADLTSSSRARIEPPLDWLILWTTAAAIAAVLLLFMTLINFDRLLGRVQGPVLALTNREISRERRLVIGSFLGLAAIATTVGITADAPTAFVINGALVSLGILLAAMLAALSSARERESGGLARARLAGLSALRTVLAIWLGSYRLVVPVTLLTAAVVMFHSGSNHVWGLAALPLLPYVLCIASVWCAVGLVMGLWFSPRFAALVTAALFAIVLFASSLVFMASIGGWRPNALWPGSPFLGVSTTGLDMAIAGGPAESTAWWVISWTQLYGVAAVSLLVFAARTLERRPGSEWGAAIDPAGIRWRRGPAPEPNAAVEG